MEEYDKVRRERDAALEDAHRRDQEATAVEQRIRDRLHAEEVEKWNAFNREYPLPRYLAGYVTGVLEDFHANAHQQRCVNVAVLGNSGTGKSSLLKVVLEKFPTAPILLQPTSCCEGDGTTHPTPFRVQHPTKQVHVWDLPGQGTRMFPAKTYLRDMGLRYFDVVILTTHGRWSENDMTLYSAVKFAGIQLIVVRTMVDISVDNGIEDGESTESALEMIRSNLAKDLPDLPTERLHLTTKKKHLWERGFDGVGFGSMDPLCEQVLGMLGLCTDNSGGSEVSLSPSDSVSQVAAVAPEHLSVAQENAGMVVPEHFSLESNVSNDQLSGNAEKGDAVQDLESNVSSDMHIACGAQRNDSLSEVDAEMVMQEEVLAFGMGSNVSNDQQ